MPKYNLTAFDEADMEDVESGFHDYVLCYKCLEYDFHQLIQPCTKCNSNVCPKCSVQENGVVICLDCLEEDS